MDRRTFGSLAALAIGGSVAGLAACSDGNQAGAPSGVETPTVLQKLNFYTDKAAWKPTFEAMNQISKSINVELAFTGYADPAAYEAFVKQAFRTRKVPELFTWHTGPRLAELVEQNLVAETSALWQVATEAKHVPAGLIDNYTIDAKQYGVPLNVAYWAMYYNKRVFDKYSLAVPKTWAEFRTVCDTLIKNQVTPLHQMNFIFEFVWFQALLIGSNPQVYRQLQTGEASYTDPVVVEAAKLWGEMIDKKYFVDPGVKTDPQTLLNTGQVAMAYFGTFFTGQLTALGAKPGTDYGIFVLPAVKPEVTKPQLVIETGPLLAGKGSAGEAAALAYSQWWMAPPAQQEWTKTRGDISFNPAAPSSDPELQALAAQVNDPAANFEIHKRYLEATPLPIYQVETEVFGKFVTDGGDPMPALQKLQSTAEEYWAKNK